MSGSRALRPTRGTVMTSLRAVAICSMALLASAAFAEASKMIVVTPAGAQPSSVGPADHFTGSVLVDSRFQAPAPARVGGALGRPPRRASGAPSSLSRPARAPPGMRILLVRR